MLVKIICLTFFTYTCGILRTPEARDVAWLRTSVGKFSWGLVPHVRYGCCSIQPGTFDCLAVQWGITQFLGNRRLSSVELNIVCNTLRLETENKTWLSHATASTASLRMSFSFNNDPSIDVLLLTTHVGGLGLNLTGADTVIFVEHDWNPMKDLQVSWRFKDSHVLDSTRPLVGRQSPLCLSIVFICHFFIMCLPKRVFRSEVKALLFCASLEVRYLSLNRSHCSTILSCCWYV